MDLERHAQEMMAVRRQMAGDPHRPQYHFQSPSNWVNDAHPIYWEGRYHMFYLYNPYGSTHGIVHWAHAVSDDLVHWTDLPIAMYPDTPYDKEGVRSGNVFIDDDGVPTAIYTGSNGATPNPVREQFGMLARSTDGMLTWSKHPVPVIPEPPYLGTPAHHDAQIWKDGDTWYQLVGGSYEGNGARRAPQLQGSAGVELRQPHMDRTGRQAGRLLGAALPAALRSQGRDDDRHPPGALLRRQLRQRRATSSPPRERASSTTAPRSTMRPTPTWSTTRGRAAASAAS